MVWLIFLAILCVLVFLPVGVRAIYRADNPGVWLLIGLVRIRIFPLDYQKIFNKIKSVWKTKPNKKTKAEKKVKAVKKKTESEKKPTDFGEFQKYIEPIIRMILQFLGDLRRKIRVKKLELNLVLAGDDPCDLALNYGRAWAALGALTSALERCFVIKKRDLGVSCDFTGEKTQIYARIDVTITCGRIALLVLKNGAELLKLLFKLKKLQKGGAQI